MNDNPNPSTFQYTYSAKEQEELRRIRSKYLPKEENKMALLRRLDAQVIQKANMYAIIVGVIGALILGIGIYCCIFGADAAFVLGMIAGMIGLALSCMAYPVYNRTLKKERERIAPQILRLIDELMK